MSQAVITAIFISFSVYSVPDLKFDLFGIDGDHARAELDANSDIVDRQEPLVCELEQKTGLAHGGVADYDVFEQESVDHSNKGGFMFECLLINVYNTPLFLLFVLEKERFYTEREVSK